MAVVDGPSSGESERSTSVAQPERMEKRADVADDGDGDEAARPQHVAPDGGTRAWLVIVGIWCTAFCSFGWLNSVGVFQEYYESTMLREYSDSTVAWIPSLQVFFMMALGPLIGIVYDHYGPRHLIFVGSVLNVFGLMMASLSTNYYQILLSQGVCSAIGVGTLFQPSISTIPGWFNRKRGVAYGVAAVGSSVGGVVFPIMLARLIPKLGFPWAMRISAFLMLALLVVANLTVRANLPPHPRPLTLARFVQPWTEMPFVLLNAGLFLFTFGLYIPIDFIPAEAAAAGMRMGLVEYLVPILNAASLFGRVGSGILGDKIGRYNIFCIVCTITGILALALWIPAASDGARIAYAALFGFFSGAYVSLIGALVAAISPIHDIGFRTGLLFAVISVPGLVTNPISGAILKGASGWTGAKVFAGVFSLAGSALILMTRFRETGPKLAVRF